MANRIIIPFLNSIKFVELARANLPQYFTKHFDEWLYVEQIFNFQEKRKYYKKVSPNDTDREQFQANFDPINISILDSYGQQAITLVAERKQRNKYNPDYYIYEALLAWDDLPEGFYYVMLTAGIDMPTVLISEPILLCAEIENTLLLEYRNSVYHEDVVFETGITMSLRVEGVISSLDPASKDVVYEDQILNNTLLSSRPYRVWKMFIGGSEGVPDYVIDRLNRILSCDDVVIDGKSFSKNEGAKWEKKEEENYPMHGWTIDLRESINRSSLILENGAVQNRRLLVVHNIDSVGFGFLDDTVNQNIISITEID